MEHQDPQEVSVAEGLPSNLVNQTVCVISGEYTDTVQDLVLPGPEKLVIQRFYGNKSHGSVGCGWCFNHGEKLVLGHALYGKNKNPIWIIALRQPSGSQLDYIHYKSKASLKKKDLRFDLLFPKGLTNGNTSLSGRSNLKNQEIHFYPDEEKIMTTSGAGNRRTFIRAGRTEEGWNLCGQLKEEKVNGSLYQYEGKGKDWDCRIRCLNNLTQQLYSQIKFKNRKLSEDAPLILTTSDGRTLKYFFQKHKYKHKERSKNESNVTRVTRCYLSKVEFPHLPYEHYDYKEKALNKELQISCKYRPEGRFLQTEYYHKGINRLEGNLHNIVIQDVDDFRLDRVKRQKAPVGPDQTPITIHSFVYHCNVKKNRKGEVKELLEGQTDVYDALNHLTQYTYDEDHLLTSKTRFTGNVSYQPYSTETFLWEKKGSNKGNLLGTHLTDSAGAVYQAKYFEYDEQGNVLKCKLCGKLTGLPSPPIQLNDAGSPIENGYESENKSFTYSKDGLNLVLSETNSRGTTLLYHYLPKTDLLESKYVKDERGEIRLREFYLYNKHSIVIQKIVDDGKALSKDDLTGVTERKYVDITPTQELPFGLPHIVEESYLEIPTGKKKLLQSTVLTYSSEGKPIKKEIYDADRQFVHALLCEYDPHGNVILETDPLDHTTTKQYDANDNLISQQSSASNVTIQNTYDFANRLIRQEEIHPDGQNFSITHTYDYLGNCIASVNAFGHKTEQTYDDFGRITAIQLPAVQNESEQLIHPRILKEYDIEGLPICITDAKGGKTQTEYNIRGQPVRVIYPDGSTEEWIYHLDGQAEQKIEKNKSKTRYKRDFLGRVTEEALYSKEGELLKRIRHEYNALHLLRTIDFDGHVTLFSYDGAGRLERKREGIQEQQYVYDAMGRIAEIREWYGDKSHEYRATKKIYDLLDRVVEERVESSDGLLQALSRYAFDAKGNQIFSQKGEERKWTEYDAQNNPIKIVNGMGHETHVVYNKYFINAYGQRVLQVTTTDPLGYQTIHIYDAANRLVETIRNNPFGIKVGRQSIFYDINGNQSRIIEEVIQEGINQRNIETITTYTTAQQVDTLIEAAGSEEQKVTRFYYNAFGQKSTTIHPNGTKIHFEYDPVGRLKVLRASDGSVHYRYEYNRSDQITRVVDEVSKRINESLYDNMGQLIQEKLGNGLVLKYTYDKLGRTRAVHFPDQTGVEYVYGAVDLKEVHRLVGGKRTYAQMNQKHGLNGQIIEAKLVGSNGKIEYGYDGMGRCVGISSDAYQQDILDGGFDAAGNLRSYREQGVDYQFTYDDHYQVQTEEGGEAHAYRYDSLRNRVSRDGEETEHNALNQLLRVGEEKRIYDANGNLVKCIRGNKEVCYKYDALGRLVSVKDGKSEVGYEYDSFHRRLIKRVGGEKAEKDQLFLYQGQEDIGMWRRGQEKPEQLRLLSLNERNTAVAIEFGGEVYVPLYDLLGNVVSLLSDRGQCMERYSYTVFGERRIYDGEGRERLGTVVGNPWQYGNRRWDEETGFVCFGYRYYDPKQGRWLTPDPAGFVDGYNLYAYVQNNPLRYWDRFGLLFISPGITYDNIKDLGGLAYDVAAWTASGCLSCYDYFFGESEIKHVAYEDKYEGQDEYGFWIFKKPIERTSVYCMDESLILNPDEKTGLYKFNVKLEKIVLHMNGINNSRADLEASVAYLQGMTDSKVVGIYSPRFGMWNDIKCYLKSIWKREAYEPVRVHQRLLRSFFAQCSPNATALCTCHSRGAVYVKVSLMEFPPEMAKRVELVPIAPGTFISDKLCKSVTHYISKNDIIPFLDMAGYYRNKKNIVELESYLFNDHTFQSPTFQPSIQAELTHYEK